MTLPEELLSAYVDGACTAEERASVETELERNPDARALLEDVRAARDALRALPMQPLPPGFDARALVLAADAPAARRRLRLVGVAAVAAAIVAVVGLADPSRSRTDVVPEVATLADSHGATASFENDPITNLAPVAVPVTLP